MLHRFSRLAVLSIAVSAGALGMGSVHAQSAMGLLGNKPANSLVLATSLVSTAPSAINWQSFQVLTTPAITLRPSNDVALTGQIASSAPQQGGSISVAGTLAVTSKATVTTASVSQLASNVPTLAAVQATPAGGGSLSLFASQLRHTGAVVATQATSQGSAVVLTSGSAAALFGGR